MLHVELKDLYRRDYSFLWSLLSFKAGMLNAAGFLIAGSFVSHVTGFGTQIGLALGHEDLTFGIELLLIPVTFIGGSFLAGLILDRDYSPSKIPHYPIVQLMITSLLGLIALAFSSGFFELAQLKSDPERGMMLVALLCLTCGLKNGLSTWSTHGRIRTTHLTGLSTDIGLHLPKLFKKEGAPSRYPEAKRVNTVRILTFVSFSIGSCISAMLIPSIGHKIFYVSFLISCGFSAFSIAHRSKLVSTTTQTYGEIYANPQ